MKREEYIDRKFRDFGISLSQVQVKQFLDYADLLVEWNSLMNLTAITEFEEIIQKHFIDSLSLHVLQDVSRETSCKTLIDVGTGAGFPGIPLKIAYPELQLTLLDSLKKRIGFLEEVVRRLGLVNVEAIHGRAEEIAHKQEYREKFDWCVSRAVANLSTLSEYCLPFIHKNGYFISYKTVDILTELENASKSVHILGGKVVHKEFFTLPGSDIQRSLIVIEKIGKTPEKYPRKAGLPSRQPLS